MTAISPSRKRALAFFLAILGPAVAPLMAHAEPAPSLNSLRKVPQTAQSHPFHAAAHQEKPLDLSKVGYIEEEYIISGEARVFDRPEDWKPGGPLNVVGKGPYTTRILVRRPADPKRFSGSVVVEPLNPSIGVDLPIMWGESYEEFIRQGFAWVGVSIKPVTLDALQRFDAARYQGLGMPNPRSSPCSEEQINKLGMVSATRLLTTNELGLAWDMLSEVGDLLKSSRADNPLGQAAKRLYMTGQSQSGTYTRTYAVYFSQRIQGPNRKGLYDGYLWSGGSGMVPVNQCVTAIPGGAPAIIMPPVGAPVFEIGGEGDTKGSLANRRKDGDTAPDLFRRYEIAGAAHVDVREGGGFANKADTAKAGTRSGSDGKACRPVQWTQSTFPNHYIFDGAWRNLDQWVRTGKQPPHGVFLREAANASDEPGAAFQLDQHGNALGGVRTPYLDVPTAKIVGYRVGAFGCQFDGYAVPFDSAKLKALYPTHADYVRKVEQSARALETAGWLTPTARAEIVAEAAAAAVP